MRFAIYSNIHQKDCRCKASVTHIILCCYVQSRLIWDLFYFKLLKILKYIAPNKTDLSIIIKRIRKGYITIKCSSSFAFSNTQK